MCGATSADGGANNLAECTTVNCHSAAHGDGGISNTCWR